MDKKGKKRKQDEVHGNLWISYRIYFSDPLRERRLMRSLFLVKDIKPKKTQKNKKGEVADGKKKAKKEPEEKWKW